MPIVVDSGKASPHSKNFSSSIASQNTQVIPDQKSSFSQKEQDSKVQTNQKQQWEALLKTLSTNQKNKILWQLYSIYFLHRHESFQYFVNVSMQDAEPVVHITPYSKVNTNNVTLKDAMTDLLKESPEKTSISNLLADVRNFNRSSIVKQQSRKLAALLIQAFLSVYVAGKKQIEQDIFQTEWTKENASRFFSEVKTLCPALIKEGYKAEKDSLTILADQIAGLCAYHHVLKDAGDFTTFCQETILNPEVVDQYLFVPSEEIRDAVVSQIEQQKGQQAPLQALLVEEKKSRKKKIQTFSLVFFLIGNAAAWIWTPWLIQQASLWGYVGALALNIGNGFLCHFTLISFSETYRSMMAFDSRKPGQTTQARANMYGVILVLILMPVMHAESLSFFKGTSGWLAFLSSVVVFSMITSFVNGLFRWHEMYNLLFGKKEGNQSLTYQSIFCASSLLILFIFFCLCYAMITSDLAIEDHSISVFIAESLLICGITGMLVGWMRFVMMGCKSIGEKEESAHFKEHERSSILAGIVVGFSAVAIALGAYLLGGNYFLDEIKGPVLRLFADIFPKGSVDIFSDAMNEIIFHVSLLMLCVGTAQMIGRLIYIFQHEMDDTQVFDKNNSNPIKEIWAWKQKKWEYILSAVGLAIGFVVSVVLYVCHPFFQDLNPFDDMQTMVTVGCIFLATLTAFSGLMARIGAIVDRYVKLELEREEKPIKHTSSLMVQLDKELEKKQQINQSQITKNKLSQDPKEKDQIVNQGSMPN